MKGGSLFSITGPGEQPICHSELAFAQAVVFGMFGLIIKNGKPIFEAKYPKEIGDASISNVIVFSENMEAQYEE